MGGTKTNVIDTTPKAAQPLRNDLLSQLQGGGITAPNYQPNYQPNTSFAPSTMSRVQAMGGGGGNTPAETASPNLMNILSQIQQGGVTGGQSGPGGMAPTSGMSMAGGGGGPNINTAAAPPSGIDTSMYVSPAGKAPPAGASMSGNPLMNAPVTGAGPATGGAAGPDSSPYGGIFGQPIQGPPPTSIAGLPGLDAAQINVDPQWQSIIDQIRGSAGGDASAMGGGSGGDGGVSGAGTDLMSIDQIGKNMTDPNSYFSTQVLPNLNNLFNQSNSLTAASAKESAGNLTGSGFANTLGTALNRNNAQQQQTLSSTIQGLVGQQASQNQFGAGLANQRNISSAQLAQSANALAQQARASGRADLMGIANSMMQKAQSQAQIEQGANSQYFQAGVDRNTNQAGMDQQRMMAQFAAATGMSQQAAANFLALLQGQSTAGVGPSTVTQTPGWTSMIPGIATAAATAYAGGGK